jgi:hypothetical protein
MGNVVTICFSEIRAFKFVKEYAIDLAIAAGAGKLKK